MIDNVLIIMYDGSVNTRHGGFAGVKTLFKLYELLNVYFGKNV